MSLLSLTRPLVLITALLATAVPAVADDTLSEEEAGAVVKEIEAMMKDFEAGKTETLLAKTHPALVEFMGGQEKLTEMTNQAVAGMKDAVKFLESSMEAPSKLYAAGDEVLTVVPRISILEVQGQKVKSTGFMIAIRSKDGGDWSYLDGSGLRRNPEMLWTLFPDLTRDIDFPPNEIEPVE